MTLLHFFTLSMNSILKKKKHNKNQYLATQIINNLTNSDFKMPMPVAKFLHTDWPLKKNFYYFFHL